MRPAQMLPSPCNLPLALALACMLLGSVELCAAIRAGESAPAKQGPSGSGAQMFREHLRILTSERLGGRGTGSTGGLRTIAYLEEQMDSLGLATMPAYEGSYRQEFWLADPRPAPYSEADTGLSWIGNPMVTAGSEAVALPFRFSRDADLQAGLAFVGYGLKIPELGIDEYSGIDVAGKIVLVLRGAPGGNWRDGPMAAHGHALRFTAKIANAEAAGAVGFLLVGAEPDLEPEREAALASRALTARGESRLAALWITRQTARSLFVGSGRSLSDLQAAIDRQILAGEKSPAQAARGQIEALRLHLRVRMDDPRPDLHTANLVGLLRGSDPILRQEYIVIGAHHDHLGRGAFGSLAKDAIGRLHPGADDNASGLAAMLLLAAKMTEQRPSVLRRSLLFVSFGAEELGLHGSRHFLANCPVPHKQIALMINLDMIGRAGGDRLRVEGVASGIGLATLLRSTCSDSGRQVRLREAASPRSDHWSFLRAGIPALFVNTGIHDQYHRPTDVAELVEVVPALQVVDVVLRLISKIDELDQAPQYSAEGMRRSFLRPGEKK